MWQSLILGNINVDRLLFANRGVWAIGRHEIRFIPSKDSLLSPIVYATPVDLDVLGVVEDVLFLPDANKLQACYPDGLLRNVAVSLGTFPPRAVSCYLHETLAPERVRIDGIDKDIYVYCAPIKKRVVIGKSLAAEWESGERYVWVCGRGRQQKTTMRMIGGLVFVYGVDVGNTVIHIKSSDSYILNPFDYKGVCKSAIGDDVAIETNTDRIVVFNRTDKAFLCWEWGKSKYGRLESPFDKVYGVYLHNGMVCVHGILDRPGIFVAPFPELEIEATFPYYQGECAQKGDV